MQPIPNQPWTIKNLNYRVMDGPFGLMGIASTERGVCNLRTQIRNESEYTAYLEKIYGMPPVNNGSELNNVTEELESYFRGEKVKFSSPLDLRFGTPFQRKVWKKLRTVPYGRTSSYQWLAQAINNPQACRAVGNANGRNPIPIIIPCHRIVASNGDLGGYTGGLTIKKFLLNLEQKLHAPL